MEPLTPADIKPHLGKLFTVTFIDGNSEILSFREFNEETNEIKCLNMSGCVELRFGEKREVEEIEADASCCKTIKLSSIKDFCDAQLHKAYH
ncbi:MAG: hypothetical protein JWO03_505 [Bacteroidetes bacterium]|nr:hypothetical protein [Bacteroidota bacterium]